MNKIIVLFSTFTFWAINLSAAESLNIDGVRFKLELDNSISVTASEQPYRWLNNKRFVKMEYSEHPRTANQIRRQILNSIHESLNQFELEEFAGLKNQNDIILVKSLVADTEFVRLFKIISDNSSSAVVNLSMPMSRAEQYQTDLSTMLNSVKWEANNLLAISENAPVKIVPPVGFVTRQKFKNSLVLRSSADNTLLPEANLVVSIIPENIDAQDLVAKTETILQQAKSLEKFKIASMSEMQLELGEMVMARVSARYDATQIEVDISHVTLKLNEHLLVAQLITERHAESFLKLEDVMMQILSNLIHENHTSNEMIW